MRPGYKPKPRIAALPDPVTTIARVIANVDGIRAQLTSYGVYADGEVSMRLLAMRTRLCEVMRMSGATDAEMDRVL